MPTEQPTVLVVEDDNVLREAICDSLGFADFETVPTRHGKEALAVLHGKRSIDLIVSDVQMPELDGHALLKEVKGKWPEMPMVLMTAYAEVEGAVSAMQHGATDYIAKPFEGDALIDLASRLTASKREAEQGVIAEDARTQQLVSMVQRVAVSDATVMICGESGSGKEVFARPVSYTHLTLPTSYSV